MRSRVVCACLSCTFCMQVRHASCCSFLFPVLLPMPVFALPGLPPSPGIPSFHPIFAWLVGPRGSPPSPEGIRSFPPSHPNLVSLCTQLLRGCHVIQFLSPRFTMGRRISGLGPRAQQRTAGAVPTDVRRGSLHSAGC